jgi:hypothetical protein
MRGEPPVTRRVFQSKPLSNGPLSPSSVAYSTHAQEIALILGDHLLHSLDVRSAMQLLS